MASIQLFHALERQLAEVETLKIRMKLLFDLPITAYITHYANWYSTLQATMKHF